MFEYLFPIFAFGVVITAIVCKGLLAAADVAKAERASEARSSSLSTSPVTGHVFAPTATIDAQSSHA